MHLVLHLRRTTKFRKYSLTQSCSWEIEAHFELYQLRQIFWKSMTFGFASKKCHYIHCYLNGYLNTSLLHLKPWVIEAIPIVWFGDVFVSLLGWFCFHCWLLFKKRKKGKKRKTMCESGIFVCFVSWHCKIYKRTGYPNLK